MEASVCWGQTVPAAAAGVGGGCDPSDEGRFTLHIGIRLFGSIQVVTAEGRLGAADFPSRKAKQVCAVLALAGGRPVSKDQLLETLWGDRLPRDPGATVEQAVSILRSTLARVTDVPTVVTERGRYRFDTTRVDIDLVRFNELVEAAGRVSGREQLDVLQQSLSLVVGDVLEDEPSASWIETERDRYRRLVERVALDVARLALAHDEAAVAHSAAERARRSSPLVLEEGYAADISALVRLGRRHEARSLMRELERRLADEESAEPGAETVALRALLRSPPPRGAPASTPISTVIKRPKGRERELPMLGRAEAIATITSEIENAMNVRSALVLVQGAVGTGKTRLLKALADGPARAAARVQTFSCEVSDADHPMLAAGRLLRLLARTARLRTMPEIDQAVAPMFGRFADTLDRLGPTVVLVDDLHLADPASVAVLTSLVAPGAVQSLCVVAARSPVSPAMDDLPSAAVARVVQLASLSYDDVETLGIDGLWAEAGGHPATIAACIEAARGDGELSQAATAAVLARVDEAGELSRHVLQLAATLPQPFDLTELAFTARLAGETIADLVQHAIELGLLSVDGAPGVTFAGDLIRRALAAGAPMHRNPD